MFGVSFLEIALVGLVSLLVVGPQKLPAMMRTAGEWVGKIRRMTADMRAQTGIDDILREEGIDGVAELRNLLKGERAIAARRNAVPSQRGYDAYSAEPDPALEFPVEGPDAYGALPDDLIEEVKSDDSGSVDGAPQEAVAAQDPPAEHAAIEPISSPSGEPEGATVATTAVETTAVEAATIEAAAVEPPSQAETAPPPSVRPPPPSARNPQHAPSPLGAAGSRPPPAPSRSRPPIPSASRPPSPAAAESRPPRSAGPKSAPRPPRSTPPIIEHKPSSFPPPPATPRLSPPRATTLRETPQSKAPVAPVDPKVSISEPPPSRSGNTPGDEGDTT